ncbi:MAG: CAAX prenyl protease-related protein [Thermodesulfobacteriota bacterium]
MRQVHFLSWVPDIIQRAWFPRVFPFFLFIAFIALEGLVDILSPYHPFLTTFAEYDSYLFYPVKTVLAAAALFFFWNRYSEIDLRQIFLKKNLLSGLFAGIAVFILWINMDWGFAAQGQAKGFNPFIFNIPLLTVVLISFRLFGAFVVVPVFEEIFWRSFIIRFIINPEFEEVPIGRFTWPSFVISSILFGLEHNLWLAGIMAGVSYSLVVYYTKNLNTAILAHGVTNLLLGIYVLSTGNWQFW